MKKKRSLTIFFYKEADNLCNGKLELIGVQQGSTSDVKFEYANSLTIMMEGKTETGEKLYTNNPFYFADSVEPDELDEEGFNRRVDIARYFQETIEGKPDLIYLATTVNDLAGVYKWSFDSIPIILNKLEKVLDRYKVAIDSLGGGLF